MELLRVFSGVIVWAAHFAVLYGATAVACARGAPQVVPWVAGVATLIAAAAAIGLVAVSFRRRAQFSAWMTAGVAATALLAIAFEALAVVMVPACR